MNRLLTFLLASLLYASSVTAQNGLDSVKALLPGQPDSALQILSTIVEEAPAAEDSILAQAHYYMGIAHYFNGNYYLSGNAYLKALESGYAKQSPLFKGKLLNNLGIVYDMTDRYEEGLAAYLASLELEKSIGNQNGIAQSELNIGLLLIHQRKFSEARSYLESARSKFEDAGNTEGLALVLHNEATIDEELKDYKAETKLTRSLQLYEQAGNTYEYTNVCIHLAAFHHEAGEEEKSKYYLEKATRLIEEKGYYYLNEGLQVFKAKLEIARGEFEAARARLDTLSPSNNRTQQGKWIYHLIAMSELEDAATFEKELWEYEHFLDSIYDENTSRIVSELQIIHETKENAQIINNQQVRLRSQRNILTLSLAFIFILGVAVVMLIKNHRRLQVSYRVLFLKEKETQRQFEALLKPKSGYHVQSPTAEWNQPDISTPIEEDENTIPFTHHYELWRQIVSIIEKEECYLQPDFRISDLAKLCNSNRTYISKTISYYTQMNFSAFLNRFRVELAKIELQKNHSFSFDEIGRLSGFNSTATFYRAFKDQTGLTPKQYTQMIRNEEE